MRAQAVRIEAQRKALHIAVTVLPVSYAWGVPRRACIAGLAVVLGIAIAVEVARRQLPAFAGRFNRLFGRLLRERERSPVPGRNGIAITGATWLAVSALLTVVLLPKAPAIAALWCVTAGDPAAALFGTWRTSASPTSPGKTLGGTVACAVISIAGVWSLGGYAVSSAVVIGVVAALAERFNGPIDDNALIAAAAGVAALVV